MAGIEKTTLYPPSPDDLRTADSTFQIAVEEASDPNFPKRVGRGRARWLLPLVMIGSLSLAIACSNVRAEIPPSPTAILTVQPEASPTQESANIQDEVRISKVTPETINPQDRATLEKQLNGTFVGMVNVDITSSRDRDNPDPLTLSLSTVTVQNKAGENDNYVFFRKGDKVLKYGKYQVLVDVEKGTQRVMLRYHYLDEGFDFLAIKLSDTLPGTVEQIRQALKDPATQAKLIKEFNDPANLAEVYIVNPYTNLEALYFRSNTGSPAIEQIIAQIIAAFSPSRAYAETLPKEAPTATAVPVTKTPTEKPTVQPSPTLKPSPTPESTKTATQVPTVSATATATVPATKAPEATPTLTSSELLQQAPEISGLKKKLENGQVVYYAEKGNQWGLKEGEKAGRVINYKLAKGVNLLDPSEVQKAQTESKAGLTLHPKIVERLYLETNTPEKLADDKWAIPFNFDPKNKQFTVYEGLYNGVKYLGINFNPPDSIVGLRLVSPFPGNAESVVNNVTIGTHPPKDFVPQDIKNWALSIIVQSFETSVQNYFSPVVYNETLLTVKTESTVVNSKVCKNVQIGLLIGSQAGGRNFGLENILVYKKNGTAYMVFMMKND